MSNLPIIYAHCPAGCNWETIHRSEYEALANQIKLKPEADGSYYLQLGKEYKIYSEKRTQNIYYPNQLVFACDVKTQYKNTDTGELMGGHFLNIGSGIEADPYADSFVFRLVCLERDSDNFHMVYEVAGERFESKGLLNPNCLIPDENQVKVTGATAVYVLNSDATIKAENGDNAFIRYSAHADGTDFTETWSEGQNYIGVATAQTAPTDKSAYTWCRIADMVNVVQTMGDSETVVMSQKAVTDALGMLGLKRTTTRYTKYGGDGDVCAEEESGYIDLATGNAKSTLSFSCTDFIEVNTSTTITVSIYRKPNIASVAFYDANKAYISGIDGEEWVKISGTVDIPENASYVRFSFMTASNSCYAIVSGLQVLKEDNEGEDFSALYNELKYNSLTFDYATLFDNAVDNAYVDTNGKRQSTNSFALSPYIRVNSGCVLDIGLFANKNICPVSFYDKNGIFISGVTIPADNPAFSGTLKQSNIVPPIDAYYMRCSIYIGSTGQYITITKDRTATLEADVERLYDDPLFGKYLVATGDSITAIVSERPESYASLLAKKNGMKHSIKAIWGATIARGISNTSGCILDTLANMSEDADYILLSGGANDFYALSDGRETKGVITEGYDATLDETTFCGAVESLCKTAINKWVGKKILYVITHRMIDIGDKTTLETNVATLIQILEKWGIPYVDLWHDMPSLMLPTLKNLYTTMGNAEYTGTGDGLHPNEDGYELYYVPRIETKLKSI